VNVMACVDPICHELDVVGDVIAITGATMEKAELAPLAGPPSQVTRTRAAEVAGFVIVSRYEPVVAAFWTDEATVCYVAPPSRESSSRTDEVAPRL
jgi:hypothetical protein